MRRVNSSEAGGFTTAAVDQPDPALPTSGTECCRKKQPGLWSSRGQQQVDPRPSRSTHCAPELGKLSASPEGAVMRFQVAVHLTRVSL